MPTKESVWTRVQTSFERQGLMQHIGARLLQVEPGLCVLALPYSDLIGDDIEAVCRKVAKETGIPVLPVHSEVAAISP